MTAIAGIAQDGAVWIGGDSAGVDSGWGLQLRNDPKVFVVDDRFVVGFADSFRMGNIIRYYMSPPAPSVGQDDFEYIVTTVIPEIRDVMKDHGYSKIASNVEKGGEFLLGFNGKLYHIYSDFQVGEPMSQYAGCGCGEHLVMGSLHASGELRPDLSPEDRINLALEAAESFSGGVRRPFVVESVS